MSNVTAASRPKSDGSVVPVWAWALVALAFAALYLITQENGSLVGATAAEYIHEFTHDARHALGVPCH